MKPIFIFILILNCLTAHAQKEFHVFPESHRSTPGLNSGDGSLLRPWDLQTALHQKPEVINGGDTLWIHAGIYDGRFTSNLKSTIAGKDLVVSAFKNDHVILNGNVDSKRDMVLEIKGGHVIYQNFEVTWLGEFSRNESDPTFRKGGGVRHLTGENVKFYNLKIHDVPGLGFGFWKHGAGSVIEDCMIYNNGYIAKNGKGRGEGIYVQNKSEQMRWIKNNIIFNNYYKGVEVWSAGKRADFEYVKNITLQGNIIFNSGNPVGRHYDNIIVASADRNGINVAKNIKLLDNVLYHNLDVKGRLGDGPALTLGFNKNAPIENVLVEDNVILGRSDGLRILHANSITVKNNLIHSGFVHMSNENPKYIDNWTFNNNTYFVKSPTPFRMIGYKNNTVDDWKMAYGLDKNSSFNKSDELSLPNVLKLQRSEQNPNKFHVVLFGMDEKDLTVDFSEYNIPTGSVFKISDVENSKNDFVSAKLPESKKVVFPMKTTDFQRPMHNDKAVKTPSSFSVFIIEFEIPNKEKKTKGLLGRLIETLGF